MSTATESFIVGPMPNTPAWLAERSNHIGASEAAAACGLSPYRQPLDVYREKRGEAPPREETAAMRLGKSLEPVVISEYTTRTGRVVMSPIPMYWSAERPFMSASLDGVVVGGETEYPLEAKTSSWHRASEWGDEWTDQVPDDYLCQTQQQMYVVGAEQCDLAVLLDGRTLKLYTVHRNERLIDRMIAVETELWERIVAGDPPPPNFNHPGTIDLVREMYGVEEGETVDLAPDTLSAWNNYRTIGEQIKAMEEERDAEKARVLFAMGNAAIGDCGDGRLLVRSTVNRKEYVCKASSYIQLREKKKK